MDNGETRYEYRKNLNELIDEEPRYELDEPFGQIARRMDMQQVDHSETTCGEIVC